MYMMTVQMEAPPATQCVEGDTAGIVVAAARLSTVFQSQLSNNAAYAVVCSWYRPIRVTLPWVWFYQLAPTAAVDVPTPSDPGTAFDAVLVDVSAETSDQRRQSVMVRPVTGTPTPGDMVEGMQHAQRLHLAFHAAEFQDLHNSLVAAAFKRQRFGTGFRLSPFTRVPACVVEDIGHARCTLNDVLGVIDDIASRHACNTASQYTAAIGIRNRHDMDTHIRGILQRICDSKADAGAFTDPDEDLPVSVFRILDTACPGLWESRTQAGDECDA